MMKLNTQFEQIHQSSTVALADRIQALKASGRQIIPLHVGDPDFATPSSIVEVAVNAMKLGLTHYCPSRGMRDLRVAVASKLDREFNDSSTKEISYDPDREILVTHGGIHAYYLAMQAILNPGDEVLIPDPSWATHSNMVKQLRGSVVHVPAFAENGFLPHLKAWKNAITPATRAIVINYPANPTGVYPTRNYLQQLQTFAGEHELWVVSDEVYETLFYNEKPVSAGSLLDVKDRTILVNSLSKTYAMTGWRVGYLAAPEKVIENALKAAQNSITCVAPFVQKAAAFALSDAGVQEEAAAMRSAYARRREMVMQIYRDYGTTLVCVEPPQGAFYFFLDFKGLKLSSNVICERILEEAGVGLTPGSAFGAQGEGFARMTIAASDEDVAAGFKAILDWARTIKG
jgi:aspartate/methionine/tyrosine aminotransferase